ncbi:MAG: hypothetical protein LBD78_03180 [Spirochaetaceae bacterium]|nr:hypothetical protein [Spirochaetaceae bacterium]
MGQFSYRRTLAGITPGLYSSSVFTRIRRTCCEPCMDDGSRSRRYQGWQEALRMVTGQYRPGT